MGVGGRGHIAWPRRTLFITCGSDASGLVSPPARAAPAARAPTPRCPPPAPRRCSAAISSCLRLSTAACLAWSCCSRSNWAAVRSSLRRVALSSRSRAACCDRWVSASSLIRRESATFCALMVPISSASSRTRRSAATRAPSSATCVLCCALRARSCASAASSLREKDSRSAAALASLASCSSAIWTASSSRSRPVALTDASRSASTRCISSTSPLTEPHPDSPPPGHGGKGTGRKDVGVAPG
eukprot:scaffold2297_cov102-Isochrysis_galbana.AAC.14